MTVLIERVEQVHEERQVEVTLQIETKSSANSATSRTRIFVAKELGPEGVERRAILALVCEVVGRSRERVDPVRCRCAAAAAKNRPDS